MKNYDLYQPRAIVREHLNFKSIFTLKRKCVSSSQTFSIRLYHSIGEWVSAEVEVWYEPEEKEGEKNSLECFRSWFGNRPSCFEENPTTERKWFRQVNTMLLRSLPLEVWLTWSSLSCHLALPFWSLKFYPFCIRSFLHQCLYIKHPKTTEPGLAIAVNEPKIWRSRCSRWAAESLQQWWWLLERDNAEWNQRWQIL